MNKITLKGVINNIEYSHNIGDIIYNKADIQIDNKIYPIRFKKFSNVYNNGDSIELIGNLRSYSEKLEDKNKVHLYTFTYFDKPEDNDLNTNIKVDGRICKIENLRIINNQYYIHFTLANNIIAGGKKLNTYIPCISTGDLAKYIAENLNISDEVFINGTLNYREYTKNSEQHIAYELIVNEMEIYR